MSTLLKAYVRERPPRDWKALFREATNIGFMIKYALGPSRSALYLPCTFPVAAPDPPCT